MHAFADAYTIDKHYTSALEHDNEDDNENLVSKQQ